MDILEEQEPAFRNKPSWDDWGKELALATAQRADCSRRKVGAVIMRPDHTIVATGYNGAPSGDTGCLSGGCPRARSDVKPDSSYDTGPGACIAVHAEANALLRASWDQMKGSTIYITHAPCPGCMKLIRATPIAHIVY